MIQNHRPYVFVSYCHKDTMEVLPLIEGIKNRGFQIWYDAGIEAGTEWPEYIGEKLFECSCVVVFLTQNSADSANCRREIDFAIELDKKLLVIYLTKKEDINLTPGLRLQINNKQAMFMLNSPTAEDFLNNLSMAEILKPCRITEEWDRLYPEKDFEDEPDTSASALPKLTRPKQAGESDSAESKNSSPAEAAALYRRGQELLEAGQEADAFRHFQDGAAKGHPDAIYELAECFRLGRGTEKQPEKAYIWYQTAAQKGMTKAMLRQAICYEQENGTQKGHQKAFLLLTIAAKLNNVEAMYELALCYLEGKGTPKDPAEAVDWLEKAARKEFVQAMYKLGMYYRYTHEPKDPERAYTWFDSAAYWRHPGAMYEMGKYLGEQYRYEEERHWYELAAENGHIEAIYRILETTDQARADLVKWYRKAAEHGDAPFMYALAECYAEGTGVEPDPQEAAKWYRASAEAGNYKAAYQWAECLFHGHGTAKNLSDAFVWYKKAASVGSTKAKLMLADCYLYGWGTHRDVKESFDCCRSARELLCIPKEVSYKLAAYYAQGIGTEKDPTRAFSCYLEAATGGLEEAFPKLARCYETGFGTEPDLPKALHWYLKAAENGLEEAMCKVADWYASGTGTEPNPIEAFAWYQRASETSEQATYKLAMCYHHGFGTPADENEALHILDHLAHIPQGYCDSVSASAYNYLARYCEATEYLKLAERYFCEAAARGCTAAYETLLDSAQYRPCWLLHPIRRFRRWRAMKLYIENVYSFEPVLLPWEKPQSTDEI